MCFQAAILMRDTWTVAEWHQQAATAWYTAAAVQHPWTVCCTTRMLRTVMRITTGFFCATKCLSQSFFACLELLLRGVIRGLTNRLACGVGRMLFLNGSRLDAQMFPVVHIVYEIVFKGRRGSLGP